MKKLFLVVSVIVLFSFNQTTQEKTFKISGVVNGDYSDYIYLNYGKKKDSTKVANNRFEFNGHVERPIEGRLNLRPDANVAWIWIENSDIEISGDFFKRIQDNKRPINLYRINEVKGSHSAKIQEDYRTFYQSNKTKDNFSSLLYEKLKTYIKENRSHPYSGKILGDLAVMNPILTRNEFNNLYSLIDTTQQNKEDLKMFKTGIANLGTYSVGKPFLKFKLPSTNEKEIDIESYLGKITLVDFWASWCGPCRAKHPELIELKNKIKNKNFDILSISIDDNKSSWLKAIEKDKLPWINLLDINKKVSSKLGIVAIPYNYLIDENGNIIGSNLSIEKVEELLNIKSDK